MNQGSSNRLIYDACYAEIDTKQSTDPFRYAMYQGKHENCNKCIYRKLYHPYDLVDQESELMNITRPATKCPSFKYNPRCKKSKSCTSTFDKSNPVVLAPEVCPIIFNNIPKVTDKGFDSRGAVLTCSNKY